MKVNFMIVGAQKCGTTTLFNILKNHPSLVGSSPKEPGFFNLKSVDRLDFDYYHSLFDQKEHALYFEATPGYTFYPSGFRKIWEFIYDYNPDMKFIYLVRNPVDRIISNYVHFYLRGYTDDSLEDAISSHPFYINVSRYYTQIYPYVEQFGRDKVLIIDFEDLINNRKEMLAEVSLFLGINPDLFDEKVLQLHSNRTKSNKRIHHRFDPPSSIYMKIVKRYFPYFWNILLKRNTRTINKKPDLDDACREMIIRMIELDIKSLEELTGKNFSKWYVNY